MPINNTGIPLASHWYRSCFRAVYLGFAIAMASASIVIAPAHATLLISNRAPHAATWKHLYSQLPSAWKTSRMIRVVEVSDTEMERLVSATVGTGNNRANDNSVVDACYQGAGENEEDPPTITLRASLTGEQASLIFTHEYGHFIWEQVLPVDERSRFAHIWREQKRLHRLVTAYAGDSVEEGFAEDFAHFLRKSALLHKRDSRGWKYLNELLLAQSESTSYAKGEEAPSP